jgi:hypothetical protein
VTACPGCSDDSILLVQKNAGGSTVSALQLVDFRMWKWMKGFDTGSFRAKSSGVVQIFGILAKV